MPQFVTFFTLCNTSPQPFRSPHPSSIGRQHSKSLPPLRPVRTPTNQSDTIRSAFISNMSRCAPRKTRTPPTHCSARARSSGRCCLIVNARNASISHTNIAAAPAATASRRVLMWVYLRKHKHTTSTHIVWFKEFWNGDNSQPRKRAFDCGWWMRWLFVFVYYMGW